LRRFASRHGIASIGVNSIAAESFGLAVDAGAVSESRIRAIRSHGVKKVPSQPLFVILSEAKNLSAVSVAEKKERFFASLRMTRQSGFSAACSVSKAARLKISAAQKARWAKSRKK
jgi:hypothetical protein